jgi:dTDP-4-amino-4,6-dideoxygalactose transaminase
VTDGDIRRALLQGQTLDDRLDRLPFRAPVAFKAGTDEGILVEALQENGIMALVVVDEDNHPVQLVSTADLHKAILLSPPHIGPAEAEYVHDAFDRNWIAPAGPNLDAFERELQGVSGLGYAIALASGTAGLHLALRALDLKLGSRIYVSDLTFAGSLQPILYERFRPVLIDSEPDSWNMSPQALSRRLEKDTQAGELPGAIIVVHLYGQSADMDAIVEIADGYGVPIIEDAAESVGARYGNRPSGSHGRIGVYSFNGNKIITTSGGGALVTDDAGIAATVRNLATQGRDPTEHYQHSEIAYNYRMSNVLAGIGLGQIEVLHDRVAARRRIFSRYEEGLADIPGISFQKEVPASVGNRWLTVVNFDPNRITLHPYQIMRRLRQNGIESRPAWKPMHMQPLCYGMDFEPHTDTDVVSASLYLRSLCLPSGSSLTDAEQDRVIAAIHTICSDAHH